MAGFAVWDELNSDEENSKLIIADSAEDAAIEYGEKDSDGRCDGLYIDADLPIMVRDMETKELYRYQVRIVDWEPQYAASGGTVKP